MKRCNGCHKLKEDKEFTKRRYKSGHIGLKSKCNECRQLERDQYRNDSPKDNERNKQYNKEHADEIRGKKLVKNYWPTLTWREALTEWNRIFVQQDGHCALCPNTRRLHVDHWHGTFIVRGLLCYNCNNGIGRLKDNPERLRAAASYIEKTLSKT
jgi:hypothetical protein